MSVMTTKIVGPSDGEAGFLGSIGVRFMIDGPESAERFSLVEHLMSPHALVYGFRVHQCPTICQEALRHAPHHRAQDRRSGRR